MHLAAAHASAHELQAGDVAKANADGKKKARAELTALTRFSFLLILDVGTMEPEELSGWRRLREAYRLKQRTDQTFSATVIAIKVCLFVLALVAVLFFSFRNTDARGPTWKESLTPWRRVF